MNAIAGKRVKVVDATLSGFVDAKGSVTWNVEVQVAPMVLKRMNVEPRLYIEMFPMPFAGLDALYASEISDPYFIVSRVTQGGTKYVRAVSCSSVSDCLKKKDAMSVSGSFIDRFPYSNDTETSFKTTVYHSGFAMNGTCLDGGVEQLTATKDVATGTFRIESRLETAPYPAGSGSSCDTKAAKAAAAGQPCSELEVVQGQFAQPL